MNTPRLLPVALALFTILPTGVAAAEGSTTVVGETRYESFEDDLVSGDLMSSDLALVGGGHRVHRHTLIRARENFHPEMRESVEDL